MGFTVVSTSGNAVRSLSRGYTNVVVRNGTLSAPNGNGLDLTAGTSAMSLVEKVRVFGCQNSGLVVEGNSLVRECEVYECGLAGIKGTGAVGVRACHLEGNGTGLELGGGSRAVGNTILSNSGAGLKLTGSRSFVADNIVRGNGDNYSIEPGNQLNLLLCEIPESIDWACSVRLVGTLSCLLTATNGITVTADDVAIDMDGHTLIGPGIGSGHGIYQDSSFHNLRVSNGNVVNWRDGYRFGVYAAGHAAVLTGLQCVSNWYGIGMARGGTISGCTALANDQAGICANSGTTISGCTAVGNGGEGGIYVDSNCRVVNNCCQSNLFYNTTKGIYVTGHGNLIDGNNVTANGYGIYVVGNSNLVVRNTARGNLDDFQVPTGGTGTIQTSPVGAGAWDNFSY